jgi:proto-oncogene serine/threonine-protein kinase mos
LKPPNNFINFDTPNRESNIEGINEENNYILGRGTYGIVFRASYKKCNVAVKIIEKSNSVKYESMKRETNILNLKHDNIVKILKVVDCKSFGAIIMERFDGKCLQEVLDSCNIDLLHRLYILSDITRALVFCQENGIVHSDLKPQNVLVVINKETSRDRDYICKLIDFGCSLKIDSTLQDSFFGVSLHQTF